MSSVLNKRVLRTPFDGPDGAIGKKKLAVLVVAVVAIGLVGIVVAQRYITSVDTWEATVTGVARGTVNFTYDEASNDIDVASYPEGMEIEEGDAVLIRTDEDEGNVVVEVLDE